MDAFEDTQTGHMVGEEFLCAFVERYLAVICHRYRTQSLWLKLGVQHEGRSTKAVQVIATDTAFCVSTKFSLYVGKFTWGLQGKLKTFAFASFIDGFTLRITVGETELYVTASWDVLGQLLYKSGYNLIHIAEADVGQFTYHFAFEIGTCINHLLLCDAEEYIFRFIQISCFTLFTLLITEEDKINNLCIQFPCWSKVNFHIATSNIKAMTMVHAKSDFI